MLTKFLSCIGTVLSSEQNQYPCLYNANSLLRETTILKRAELQKRRYYREEHGATEGHSYGKEWIKALKILLNTLKKTSWANKMKVNRKAFLYKGLCPIWSWLALALLRFLCLAFTKALWQDIKLIVAVILTCLPKRRNLGLSDSWDLSWPLPSVSGKMVCLIGESEYKNCLPQQSASGGKKIIESVS